MSHIIPVGYVMILYLSIFIAVIRGHSNILSPLSKSLDWVFVYDSSSNHSCSLQVSN